MTDLIDRDELKNRLKWGWPNDKFVLRTVNEMPQADAEPIVRCKDCNYYNTKGCSEGAGWCERDGCVNGRFDDWYCADGERKEDDE